MKRLSLRISLLSWVLILSACGSGSSTAPTNAPSITTSNAGASPVEPRRWPTMVVHKSESCGCCKLWVQHMKHAGFNLDVRNVDNLGPIKDSVGIPAGKGSCHTALIDRYFIEGHVPAEDVVKLLSEHPDAKGLTVPGMPAGSPGMESPSGKIEPYDVLLVANDGTTSVYAHHGGVATP